MSRDHAPTGRRGGWSSLDPVNLRATLRPLLVVIAVGGAVVFGMAVLYVVAGIGPMTFLDDVASVAALPWYAGAVGSAGNLLWAGAMAMALLTAAAVRRHEPAAASFLAAFGVLTLVLLLGDQYMLHERVSKQYLGSELPVIAVYLAAAGYVAVRHGRFVLGHPDGFVLFCALAFLGLALLLDVTGSEVSGRQSLEESTKLLGTMCWTLFAARAGLRALRDAQRPLDDSVSGRSRLVGASRLSD